LALCRGGVAVDEPYAWWDSLSDEAVEFWEAFWRIEPWGGDWERHGEIMSTLDHLYAVTANQFAEEGKGYKPLQADAFMPADYLREKKRKPKVDFEQQFQAFVQANSS